MPLSEWEIHGIPSVAQPELTPSSGNGEKMKKTGVLKMAKQIVEEEKKKELEKRQLATYDSKARSQRKLKSKWKQEKLHGQYLKRGNASDINKKSTNNWLRRGKLKSEAEAFITAAQTDL